MKELAKQCIEHVGGAANIQAVSHCATRLRLTLRDQSQVNEAALTALPEVIKVMQVGAQTQIIIGSDAPELYGVVSQLVDQAQSEAPAKSAEAAEKQPVAKNKKKAAAGKFFDACSSMFTPLVPAFTAAGMIKAVLAILVAVFGLAKTSQEYIIINYVSDTIFQLPADLFRRHRRFLFWLQQIYCGRRHGHVCASGLCRSGFCRRGRCVFRHAGRSV